MSEDYMIIVDGNLDNDWTNNITYDDCGCVYREKRKQQNMLMINMKRNCLIVYCPYCKHRNYIRLIK